MPERSTGFILPKYWIPAILVAILISIFSTRYLADEQTGRIIISFLHRLYPSATDRMLYLMHVGIRKLAHVAEFGLFSAAVFRGVRAGRTGWRWSDRLPRRVARSIICLMVCHTETAFRSAAANPRWSREGAEGRSRLEVL